MTARSIAVVPVRAAVLPAGAEETIAEAGGVVLLAGSGTAEAAAALAVDAVSVAVAEIGDPAFGAWGYPEGGHGVVFRRS